MTIDEIVNSLPKLEQVQYSLIDQLWKLILIADKIRLDSAYTYLREICKIKNTMCSDPVIDNLIRNLIAVSLRFEKIFDASLAEQLSEIRKFAVKLGLYDADDFIKNLLGV